MSHWLLLLRRAPETGDAVKFNLFTVTVARTPYASRGVAVHWPGIAEFWLTSDL